MENNIENVLNFYVKANQLKYQMVDENHSKADNLYGSIILALAFNSEFNVTENISKVIRMLFLNELIFKNGLYFFKDTLKKGNIYQKEVLEFHHLQTLFAKIAFKCKMTNLALTHLIDEEGATLSFEDLYHKAIKLGIFKLGTYDEFYGDFNVFSNMFKINDKQDYEKYKRIFKFYYLNNQLRNKLRSGWDKNHWNIKGDKIECIFEHIIGTIALAIAIDSEFDFNINLDKVIEMLSIHEVGEILIGDITPFDGISPTMKKEIEHKAINEVLECLTNKKDLANLIFEFDERNTNESIFGHYCDKIEADIQAKVYQDMGRQNPLTEQQNNVVFKSDKVKQMITDGAQTAFDIWYLWDKIIYEDNLTFTEILDYINNHDLTKLCSDKRPKLMIIRKQN